MGKGGGPEAKDLRTDSYSPDVRLHVLTHGAHQGRLFPCALAYVHMSRHTDVYGPGVQLAWVEGW